MPRVFDVVPDGDGWKYEPNTMLAGEPEVKSSPKMEVTYKLSGKGVWDDGTPISCADFKYTWEQVTTAADIYDTTGYRDVESVTESAPNTCVVSFKNPYAGWKGTLFGGQFGIYPSHLLQGKDRNAAMKDGYTFSGGPFKMEKWEKGVAVTLVPNTKYWGEQPKVDKVIFQVIPDTAQEFNAFKSGEVLAIYPQPQIATIDAMGQGGLDATQIVSTNTGNLEALWMNNAKAPLDSKAVRQAIAYGLDRDALVKALFGGIKVDKAVHSLNPPITSKYADDQAYAMYKKDLGKVESLMTGDGWAKGSDGIWAKGGQRATIELMTTAGNKRRELTEQVVQQQLKEAGFDITINNQKSGDLFGQILPAGEYQMGLYAQVATSLDPTLCSIACSANIPGPANNNSGQNWQRINIPEVDKNLQIVETSNDDAARVAAGKAADQALAADQASLPLDPLPNISMWNDRVKGPINDNPILSMFWNMYAWSL
jgi:peptide/nickel transport system substrate-binding protein